MASRKRGPGRPTREARPSEKVVRLRVTAGERREWQQAASQSGESLSEWIRRRLGTLGRPSLGDDAKPIVVNVRVTEDQYRAIAAYVAKENDEIKAAGGDGKTATVSTWLRDVIEESIP